MSFDHWLFDAINGVAGRYGRLDHLGQGIAVFGLLGVLLLVVTLCWWPHWEREVRRDYLRSMLLSCAACALLFVIEWFVVTHILHHELRARPSNVRWATLLITERSHHAFPAWPVLIAFALGVPTLRLSRHFGTAILLLGTLLAVSLIFVGVNYPYDVLTGIFVGCAIGIPVALLTRTAARGIRRRRWAISGVIWLLVMLWGGIMLATIKSSRAPEEASPLTEDGVLIASAAVTPPDDLLRALTPLVQPGTLTVQAAGNGHLVAGWARVVLPDAGVDLPRVENLARQIANTFFARWQLPELLTIEIAADFPHGSKVNTGTLYTVTLTRAAWPAGGVSRGKKLPGRKYFHAKFTSTGTGRTAQRPQISTGRP